MSRTILLALTLLLPASCPAQVQRYSFHRSVVITVKDKSLVRESEIIILDNGQFYETAIVQTGQLPGIDLKYWQHFPAPDVEKLKVAMAAGGSMPESMAAPFKSLAVHHRDIEVTFSRWRVFRTSLVIKELE